MIERDAFTAFSANIVGGMGTQETTIPETVRTCLHHNAIAPAWLESRELWLSDVFFLSAGGSAAGGAILPAAVSLGSVRKARACQVRVDRTAA